MAQFEVRRDRLLAGLAAQPLREPPDDLYANQAVARLQLGIDPSATNAQLRWVAGWFDRPHPQGRNLRGECDFAAIRLARAHHLFAAGDKLEPATRDAIRDFFLRNNFQSIYNSENHHLLFRVSRYLVGSAYPRENFAAWKKTGKVLAEEDAAWLERFIQYRAAHGWGEFDSSCYIRPDMEALLCLYDFAPDARLRQLSGMMLDLLLADMSVDSLDGMVGGAQGRIYVRQALDHTGENTWPIQYLYFGNIDDPKLGTPRRPEPAVDTLTSSYRPRDIVRQIALDRPGPYLNRERKHLHNVADPMPRAPLDGSIRKYTWYTPQYVLGSVQKQDPYPPGAGAETRGYAWHEQHDWDLTIAGGTRARIFTHHPGNGGNEHGYWTGDMSCGCGQFMQQGPVVLALYDIPKNEAYQSIHAYLPMDEFDQVLERDGWIFARKGKVYVGLKLVGGYQWTQNGEWAGVEVRSTGGGGRHAVVCEVGLASDYSSFEAFATELASNPLSFDERTMTLGYGSRQSGALSFSHGGRRQVNGQAIPLDYPTYDCPYLQSAWGSGVVELIHGDRRLRLDFPQVAVKEPAQP